MATVSCIRRKLDAGRLSAGDPCRTPSAPWGETLGSVGKPHSHRSPVSRRFAWGTDEQPALYRARSVIRPHSQLLLHPTNTTTTASRPTSAQCHRAAAADDDAAMQRHELLSVLLIAQRSKLSTASNRENARNTT